MGLDKRKRQTWEPHRADLGAGGMSESDPILNLAECANCRRVWTAFLPDGITKKTEQDAELECPSCHHRKGFLLDQENTEAEERDG